MYHSAYSCLSLLLFALLTVEVTTCTAFIISSSGDCPSDNQCLTLSEFATNATILKTPNIELQLLPGIHQLKVQLKVTDVNNFTMSPYYQSEHCSKKPAITCSLSGQIKLSSIEEVFIKGVDFRRCLKMKVSSVGEFKLLSSDLSGDKNSRNKCLGTALVSINSTLSIL